MFSTFKRLDAITLAVFFAILLLQHSFQLENTNSGRPYENWDEVVNWNTSRVFNPGAGKVRVYDYGSVGSFMQILANTYDKLFDPITQKIPRISYSNNVPESFIDQDIPYKLPLRDGARHDYGHFRGSMDHHSIFVSRKIHLTYCYILIFILAFILVREFSISATPALVALLTFSLSPNFSFQSVQSLPTASAALAVTIALTLTFLGHLRKRLRLFQFALIFFAVSLHTKIDTISFSPLLGLTIAVFLFQKFKDEGLQNTKKAFWSLVLPFVATMVLLKPTLFVKPFGTINIQLQTLLGQTAKPDLMVNLGELYRFFVANFFYLNGHSEYFQKIAIVGSILLIFWTYFKSRSLYALVILGLALAINLSGVLLNSRILYVGRYFIAAQGLYYLIFGLGLTLLLVHHKNQRRSLVIPMLLCLLAGAFALPGYARYFTVVKSSAEYIRQTYLAFDGYDPEHTRNQAIDHIIKNFDPNEGPVLVDQHGYFDLRRLIENKFEIVYIHFNNYKEIIESLSPDKGYPLLFVPGDYSLYDYAWTAEERARYDSYSKEMSKFKTSLEITGPKMELLSGGIVKPKDHVIVKVVTTL
jgi:hypothetical protein